MNDKEARDYFDMRLGMPDINTKIKQREAYKKARGALDKVIPEKPIFKNFNIPVECVGDLMKSLKEWDREGEVCCPNCEQPLLLVYINHLGEKVLHVWQHCGTCGQAIDWSEE